ncbi:MAG: S1 family peptidase [Myxococcales bacterium]|nr:S1 family peptidase [Myxococcales bacterium]
MRVTDQGRATRVRGSLCLRVGLLLALGCAPVELGSREPIEGTTDELIGGVYTYERPEVGSISGCTATLVGPRLVITAAHCLNYATRTTPGNYGTFEIRRSASNAQRYTIERFVSYGRAVGPDDIALIRLASPVPAAVATPARLARANPSNGASIAIYGYGCQARGTRSTWAKQKINSSWGRTTTNLCPGDSGGPTLGASGDVIRINSGYYLQSGVDIFGSVPRLYAQLESTARGWGDSFGQGSAEPPPPPPSSPDAGTYQPPPPPPPSTNPCDRRTCEEATGLFGCGWCEATGRGIRTGAYNEALEPCAWGFRLYQGDCASNTSRSTCGPWNGFPEYTCRQGGAQFVRCIEGRTPEFLTCPSGYACQPGSTERHCYRQ